MDAFLRILHIRVLVSVITRIFALAYAANDGVLILLWILAARGNRSYLSVVVCFLVFLANDIYGYVNWSKMEKRQQAEY